MVQLSWFLSHPYNYIWFVYLALSLSVGFQGAILTAFATKERIATIRGSLAIASLWVVMEWSRLFWGSGLSFNPVGMALASNVVTLQMATWGGVFLLSFWVMVTALLLTRWWYYPTPSHMITWGVVAAVPYLLGTVQLHYHAAAEAETSATANNRPWHLLALQTAFPVEEKISFDSMDSFRAFLTDEWREIITLAAPFRGMPLDLVVLPEGVVPFSAYSPLYSYHDAVAIFQELCGTDGVNSLPPPEPPFGDGAAPYPHVSSAFWAQALANYLDSGVLIGLEDAARDPDSHHTLHYSAALHFIPSRLWDSDRWPPADSYAKRVLIPLGEYIPFAWCRSLALAYGVGSSFTPGTKATTFLSGSRLVSPCICYEETFGNMMREGRQLGALLLANVTNDGWYPHSRLAEQHRDHSRLRTIENGIPLIRACNTGVTTAIDSVGRTVAFLDEADGRAALYVTLPSYSYHTPYTSWGDFPIIALSFLLLFGSALPKSYS